MIPKIVEWLDTHTETDISHKIYLIKINKKPINKKRHKYQMVIIIQKCKFKKRIQVNLEILNN